MTIHRTNSTLQDPSWASIPNPLGTSMPEFKVNFMLILYLNLKSSISIISLLNRIQTNSNQSHHLRESQEVEPWEREVTLRTWLRPNLKSIMILIRLIQFPSALQSKMRASKYWTSKILTNCKENSPKAFWRKDTRNLIYIRYSKIKMEKVR